MSQAPKLSTDYFLTSLASQLSRNYGRFQPQFFGGRVFFTVDEGGNTVVRTLLMAADRPQLFSGHLSTDEKEGLPQLHLSLTITQLAQFFTGRLDPTAPVNANVVFDGNSRGFYEAIGGCL